MPAAIAIPAIASVGSAAIAGGAGYLSSRQSPQQKALLASQQNSAQQQSALAQKLTEIAGQNSTLTGPAYQKAIDYYTSMAGGGGTAKQQQAVQPDVNRLNEQYKGAATRISRQLTGPARDQALADLVRQHAAQIGELTGAPRQAANDKLLQIGEQGQQNTASLYGAAGSAFGGSAGTAGNLYNQVDRTNQGHNAVFGQLGQDFSKLWAPYLKNMGTKGAKSAFAGPSSFTLQ